MALQPKDVKLATNTDCKTADKLEAAIDIAMAQRGFNGHSFDYETDVEVTSGIMRELQRRYHGWDVSISALPLRRSDRKKKRYTIRFTTKEGKRADHCVSKQPRCLDSESDFYRVSDYLPRLRSID